MLSELVNVGVMTPYRLMRLADQTLRQRLAVRSIAEKPPILRSAANALQRGSFPAPPVQFGPVSLQRVKAVKTAYRVKVNDVVLALVAGALRSYLLARGELPDRPLIAQVPVSTRTEETDSGNAISSMTVSLPTEMKDPARRIRAIFRVSQAAKQMSEALTAHQIMGLTETTPPGLFRLAARAFIGSRLGQNVRRSTWWSPMFPAAGTAVRRRSDRRGLHSDRAPGDGRRPQCHVLQLP